MNSISRPTIGYTQEVILGSHTGHDIELRGQGLQTVGNAITSGRIIREDKIFGLER